MTDQHDTNAHTRFDSEEAFAGGSDGSDDFEVSDDPEGEESAGGVFDDADADADEESYLDDHSSALWEGDRGSLDAKQRDTLVSLLKKAFISSDDRAEWKTLTRDPGPIATSLNNMYFNLVIDERSEVAYATPARTADNPFKTLVRDAPNNREETLLLLYLREKFRSSLAAGEVNVYTDGVAMYEYVQRLRPTSATDQAGDEKRVTSAIGGLVTAGLLVKTKDEGRYRVHRAIETLLPLPKLNQLLEAFRRLNAGHDNDQANPTDTYTGKHAAPEPVDLPDDEPNGVTDDTTDANDGSGAGYGEEMEETA